MEDITKEDIIDIFRVNGKKIEKSSLRFRSKSRYIFLGPVYIEVRDPR